MFEKGAKALVRAIFLPAACQSTVRKRRVSHLQALLHVYLAAPIRFQYADVLHDGNPAGRMPGSSVPNSSYRTRTKIQRYRNLAQCNDQESQTDRKPVCCLGACRHGKTHRKTPE